MKKNQLLWAFVFLTSQVYALPSDREQILNASSDSALLLQNSLVAEYTGHVSAKQGTTLLNAEKLTVKMNPSHQVESATATGHPAVYSTQLPGKPTPLVARAEQIQYYPLQHLVILSGNAVVTQTKDTYTAPLIYYDTLAQTVKSPQTQGQQVHIVLQPKAASHENHS